MAANWVAILSFSCIKRRVDVHAAPLGGRCSPAHVCVNAAECIDGICSCTKDRRERVGFCVVELAPGDACGDDGAFCAAGSFCHRGVGACVFGDEEEMWTTTSSVTTATARPPPDETEIDVIAVTPTPANLSIRGGEAENASRFLFDFCRRSIVAAPTAALTTAADSRTICAARRSLQRAHSLHKRQPLLRVWLLRLRARLLGGLQHVHRERPHSSAWRAVLVGR